MVKEKRKNTINKNTLMKRERDKEQQQQQQQQQKKKKRGRSSGKMMEQAERDTSQIFQWGDIKAKRKCSVFFCVFCLSLSSFSVVCSVLI